MNNLLQFDGLKMYESEKYYKDIFSAVADDIKEYRDELYHSPEKEDLIDSYFDIPDINDNSFQQLVDTEKGAFRLAIEIIIKALMNKKRITLHEPKGHPDRVGRNVYYFSFVYETSDSKKTGVKLLWNSEEIHGIKYFLKNIEDLKLYEEVDKIEVIILEKEVNISTSGTDKGTHLYSARPHVSKILKYNSLPLNNTNGFVEFTLLESFFRKHFGDKEYSIFSSEVNSFIKRKKVESGYKTVFVPNKHEIERFRIERLDALKQFDYKSELKKSIQQLHAEGKIKDSCFRYISANLDKLITICYTNYLNRFRLFVLSGNKDYAESFISSEWHYLSSFETDILDKTAIAVGYLKSAEQLLYNILRLHINEKGYNIRHTSIDDSKCDEDVKKLKNTDGKYPKYIPFDTKYEKYFNTTFGSLNAFVKYYNYKNNGLFEINIHKEWINYIIQFLSDYCKEERNPYLHKENIYKPEEINSIRKRTLLLYFLLLGSFHIEDKKLRELGGDSAFTLLDSLFKGISDFYKWIDPKIQECHSSDSVIVLALCVDLKNGCNDLQFVETNDSYFKDYRSISESFVFDDDIFILHFEKCQDTEKNADYISALVNSYISIKENLDPCIHNHKFAIDLYGNGYRLIH